MSGSTTVRDLPGINQNTHIIFPNGDWPDDAVVSNHIAGVFFTESGALILKRADSISVSNKKYEIIDEPARYIIEINEYTDTIAHVTQTKWKRVTGLDGWHNPRSEALDLICDNCPNGFRFDEISAVFSGRIFLQNDGGFIGTEESTSRFKNLLEDMR